MKKINYLLITIITFILGFTSVYAADIGTYVTGPTSITAGDEFTVTVGISGGTNIYGVTGAFSYDTSKLELVSSAGASGFALTLGGTLVVDTASAQSGNFAIATMVFKAKTDFAVGQNTTISFNGVLAGDGTNEFVGSDSSLTINSVAPKSTNNFLSSLSVDVGKINFNKNTTSYTITVDNKVTSAKISATAEDGKATVMGYGTKKLNVYGNTFYITVTSESGAKKTYAVIINRKDEKGNATKPSDDNTLSSIIIDGFELDFNSDKLEYDLEVEEDIDKLNITANASNKEAKIEIEGNENLVVGENVVTIKVTSADGEERIYTINVFKKEKAENTEIDIPKKEEKDCNHLPFIIPLVIESLAILGLVGYIIYDKKIKNNRKVK